MQADDVGSNGASMWWLNGEEAVILEGDVCAGRYAADACIYEVVCTGRVCDPAG